MSLVEKLISRTIITLNLFALIQACKDLDENARESVEAYVNNKPSSGKLSKSFRSFESISGNITRILSAPSDQYKSHEDSKPDLNNVEMKDSVEETKPLKGELVVDLNVLEGEENIAGASGSVDVKMEEAKEEVKHNLFD